MLWISLYERIVAFNSPGCSNSSFLSSAFLIEELNLSVFLKGSNISKNSRHNENVSQNNDLISQSNEMIL